MTNVISATGQFFLYSLMAVFAQNAVFSRAFGVSRLVKLVDDDAMDSFIFSALICVIQLISAPLAFFCNAYMVSYFSANSFIIDYIRPLSLIICTVIAFFIALWLIMLFFKVTIAKNILMVLPMASFNCCVLGTLLITTTQQFTFLQTMGFAFGSGIGYALAVWLASEGKQRFESKCVPYSFRGLPIMLLYIGILAMAIYGFTGNMLVF